MTFSDIIQDHWKVSKSNPTTLPTQLQQHLQRRWKRSGTADAAGQPRLCTGQRADPSERSTATEQHTAAGRRHDGLRPEPRQNELREAVQPALPLRQRGQGEVLEEQRGVSLEFFKL